MESGSDNGIVSSKLNTEREKRENMRERERQRGKRGDMREERDSV